jgi:superfamily II DNA helicase RecQ
MNQLQAICCSLGCNGGDLHCRARLCLEQALQQFFKFTGFRPGQLEAMLPLLHCNDKFVRMAMGSGKSFCMFLPPLVVSDSSLAVYISPLIGLMDQQVR